jgi:hypothetical protein
VTVEVIPKYEARATDPPTSARMTIPNAMVATAIFEIAFLFKFKDHIANSFQHGQSSEHIARFKPSKVMKA